MDPTQLSWQVVLNYAVVTLIQYMKKSELPIFAWISNNTPWVNRVVSAFAAAALAAGISFHFSGQGTIIISGLTETNVAHFLVLTVQNFLGMKILYKIIHGIPSSSVQTVTSNVGLKNPPSSKMD